MRSEGQSDEWLPELAVRLQLKLEATCDADVLLMRECDCFFFKERGFLFGEVGACQESGRCKVIS